MRDSETMVYLGGGGGILDNKVYGEKLFGLFLCDTVLLLWIALPLLTCLTPLSSLTKDAYFLAMVGSFYCSTLSLSSSMTDR